MTGAMQTVAYTSPGPILKMPPGSYLEPVEELPSDSDSEGYGDIGDIDLTSEVGLSNIEEEEEYEDEEDRGSLLSKDPVFEKIKETLSKTQRSESAMSMLSSVSNDSDGPHVQISEQYTSLPYGIQVKATYEHSGQHADIMGVAYNGRMRQFVILDSKGITTWKRDLVDPRVRRALQYPKYEYCLIRHIVFVAKYNCYFALGKDFSVKVLNRDFEETCSVNTDMRSVLFILFNPVRDELITGGVGGIKIWNFVQAAGKAFTELKPLANYELRLKESLPNVGGSWVKRVDLDHQLQHLYCCSDTDLHVYDLSGKLLFKFERAHTMSITGCCFSPKAKVLITASVDSEVKVWSLTGGLVHTFSGHSRAVTSLLLHPETSSIIMTASLDGSIRMWSLDTMDLLYMIVVSADGVMWMGLTDDKLLYISTCRNITLWHLNTFYSFWALARNQVTSMTLASAEDKTTRILAIGDDNSTRIFNRSNRKNMTTVLPPPDISPLQKVISLCYSREKNAAFLLVTNKEIWVYTTRTDPSCRIAVWDVHELQLPYISGDATNLPPGVTIQPPSQSMSTHRATSNGHGNEIISNCCSLCILNSTAMMWTDEGLCCPLRHTYLLLGMEDGRILFMDPVIKGQKYMEFKACKDGIREMRHDRVNRSLVTLCRLKTLVQINIWGLPQLDLLYELYCGPDVTCFQRVGLSLLTGHTSGQINFHMLEYAEDPGILKARQEPSYESIVDENKRPEHHGAVVAMDCLPALRLFVTCSSDGAIKVWDENKILMTEVMLETSLSTACFFNDMGDLLVGFKNHIFYIDHTKLCPAIKPDEIEMETSDQESDVYEDPRVLYELIKDDEDAITLENYLVPYDLEFDKDFLEGKTKIEQPKTAAEAAAAEEMESETETDISLAPSSIYLSPADSIESLSMIDLTLGADYSKYDLKDQMKVTLDYMVAKGKKKRKHVTIETLGQSDMEEKEPEIEKFSLPTFGDSPGVSPSITPPSGQGSPRSRYREGSDDDWSDDERVPKQPRELPVGFIPVEPDKAKSGENQESATSTSDIPFIRPSSSKRKHTSPQNFKNTTRPKSGIHKSKPSTKQNISRSNTLPALTAKSNLLFGYELPKEPARNTRLQSKLITESPFKENKHLITVNHDFNTESAQMKSFRSPKQSSVQDNQNTVKNNKVIKTSADSDKFNVNGNSFEAKSASDYKLSLKQSSSNITKKSVIKPSVNTHHDSIQTMNSVKSLPNHSFSNEKADESKKSMDNKPDVKQPSVQFDSKYGQHASKLNDINVRSAKAASKLNVRNNMSSKDDSKLIARNNMNSKDASKLNVKKESSSKDASKPNVSHDKSSRDLKFSSATSSCKSSEKSISKSQEKHGNGGSNAAGFKQSTDVSSDTAEAESQNSKSSVKISSEFARVLQNMFDDFSDEEANDEGANSKDNAKTLVIEDDQTVDELLLPPHDDRIDTHSDKDSGLTVSITTKSVNTECQDTAAVDEFNDKQIDMDKPINNEAIVRQKETGLNEEKYSQINEVSTTLDAEHVQINYQSNELVEIPKLHRSESGLSTIESESEAEGNTNSDQTPDNNHIHSPEHTVNSEGKRVKAFDEAGTPASKVEKPKAVHGEEEEVEATGSRRMKGVKVDVRGLMKKRRITSARAPSLTRRSSTDHAHDDHDHDHDHSHDDHRDHKKKQQVPPDLRQKMDKNKLMNLPPNPPSMLSRKRSLSEQRKSLELNLLHRPDLRSQHELATEKMPNVLMDGDADMDQLQEAQWAAEASIHGTQLTLPPQRDKNQARQTDKLDMRAQRNRDRKFPPGDKDTPGVGSSPTSEMESPFKEGVGVKEVVPKGKDSKSTHTAEDQVPEDNVDKDVDFGSNLDTNQPETQMQRAKRLGLKVDADKVFEMEKADKENGVPKVLMQRTKLKVYIPQAERESTPSARSSYRGTPDSGIDDLQPFPTHIPQMPVVIVKHEEEKKPAQENDLSLKALTDEERLGSQARPATSFTGLRRATLEGEKWKTDRPHTAHVRFKAEDLQTAFEEALKKYQNLPGTPKLVSADTLYRNEGVAFEDNWQERAIERHTLLRMQKEIRAQSAAQRRQAIEMIKQDKTSTKLFTSRCQSAAPHTTVEPPGTPGLWRANTSLSVPISFGYGVNTVPTSSREKQRPKTANPVLLKQQAIKNELSQEKPYRYKMSKPGQTASRPSSSRSISSVADFSPHWIDPRNPDAWRPKSSRSIPSKCNRYILVNKPREKPPNPVPSPLEEQLLIERFPKMGAKMVPPSAELTPRLKKAYPLEYSPFVYHRYI